jgi:hypothetical protein
MKTTFGKPSGDGKMEGYGLAKITVELVRLYRKKNEMHTNDQITHDDVEEMLDILREKIHKYEELSSKK